MLISITVENFKSFDTLTSFNMIASNKLRNNKERIVHTNGVSILKSSVIYGANASGKSNLIDAFQFIRSCILSKEIPIKASQLFCKNNADNEHRVTTFEIRMCIKNRCYSYGFDILLKDKTITSEWVLELLETGDTNVLFKREHGKFELSRHLELDKTDLDKFKIYAEDLSENDAVLFLSEMNRNKKFEKNSKLLFFKDIYHWFANDMNIFSPDTPVTNFEYYYDTDSLERVKHIITSFDTGITDIKIRELTMDELRSKLHKDVFANVMNRVKEKANEKRKGYRLSMRSKDEFFNIEVKENTEEPFITTLSFKHGSSIYEFDFDEESDGTRRIFDLLDVLLTENKDSVYIIDEMERSLHPSLTKHFIELLNEYHKNSNIQLVFTTHESTIMTQDLFRRDQIWFVARDEFNNSHLYSLDRFNERYDKKISKAYLEGRYGAVPIFSNIDIKDLP